MTVKRVCKESMLASQAEVRSQSDYLLKVYMNYKILFQKCIRYYLSFNEITKKGSECKLNGVKNRFLKAQIRQFGVTGVW